MYDTANIVGFEPFADANEWGVVVLYKEPQGITRIPFFKTDELGALLRIEQYNRRVQTRSTDSHDVI